MRIRTSDASKCELSCETCERSFVILSAHLSGEVMCPFCGDSDGVAVA